jgi:hypothetical protein
VKKDESSRDKEILTQNLSIQKLVMSLLIPPSKRNIEITLLLPGMQD